MVEGSLEKKPPFEKPSIEQVKKKKEKLFFLALRLSKPSNLPSHLHAHLPSVFLTWLRDGHKSVEIILDPLDQK